MQTCGDIGRLQGMRGAIDMAERLVGEREGAYMLQQFESEANPEVHFCTTGPELWRDTAGTVDFLVAGAAPAPTPFSPTPPPFTPGAHVRMCGRSVASGPSRLCILLHTPRRAA